MPSPINPDFGITDDKLVSLTPDKISPRYQYPDPPEPAVSLRDQFAMAAIAGWLAQTPPDCGVSPQGMSEFCYEIADAMMEARKK